MAIQGSINETYTLSDDGKKILGVYNPDGTKAQYGYQVNTYIPAAAVLSQYKANVVAAGDTLSPFHIQAIEGPLAQLVN